MSKSKFIVAIAALLLVILTVAILPSVIRARTTSASNACVNILRNIKAAKEQWALENQKTSNDIPSWDDIRVYVGSTNAVPHCPNGGVYIIGRVCEPPRCSLAPSRVGGKEHKIP